MNDKTPYATVDEAFAESCIAKAIAELSMKLNTQYETVLDLQQEMRGGSFDLARNKEKSR